MFWLFMVGEIIYSVRFKRVFIENKMFCGFWSGVEFSWVVILGGGDFYR